MIGDFCIAIRKHDADLKKWFEERLRPLVAPIYSSVDVRVSGYKMAVVDTNLFPSGFNNLCRTFSADAAKRFELVLAQYGPAPLKILVIPEAHTRNPYYWEHIASLLKILRTAGHEPWVGRGAPFGIELPAQMSSLGGETIPLVTMQRQGDQLLAGTETPQLILLNNDFSQTYPTFLDGIRQPVLPAPALGWQKRRKSDHFALYDRLITEWASILDLDPWWFCPLMDHVVEVNLEQEESRVKLGAKVDQLLARIRRKHQEYHVDSEPYVFMKDDSGTYGMAVTHVSSGQEIIDLSRRKRNKLGSSKGGGPVTQFLLQEGVPTIQELAGHPLEPVFYLVGGEPVGYFFRIHAERSARDNLNARGVRFDCLCSHKVDAHSPVLPEDCESSDQVRVVGGWLAQIASYAASLELKELAGKP